MVARRAAGRTGGPRTAPRRDGAAAATMTPRPTAAAAETIAPFRAPDPRGSLRAGRTTGGARLLDRRANRRAVLTEAHNLSRIGWLSEQPQAFRERLAEISHWRRFAKGESFYEVGDPPDGVFGLEWGHVEVSLSISDDE